MKKTLLNLIVVSILLSSRILFGQEEKDSLKWTPEDVISITGMSSVSFSPKGNMVVWTKKKALKEKDKFVFDIYLTLLDMRKDGEFRTVQLTNGDENNYNPVFSKDGESVFFLSSRDKGKKLWELSIYGGEAKELKTFEEGISNLKVKDQNTLLFVSNEGKTLYEKTLEDKKDDVTVIEDSLHWKPTHVYSFDLKEKIVKRLTENKKPLTGYAISPDGKWLFYGMQRSMSFEIDGQKDPFYYLKNLYTGVVKKVLSNQDYPIEDVQFTKDNTGIYFTSVETSDPEWNGYGVSRLYYYDIAADQYQKVDLKNDYGLAMGYHVAGNGFIASLANKAILGLAYYTREGKNWTRSDIDLKDKNEHATVLAVADDLSKIIYEYSTASSLSKYYIADFKKGKVTNEQEVVKLNENLVKKPLSHSEVMTWKGYKDEEVTGILYYPEDYKEGQKYPLMLSIHGGPAGADLDLIDEGWSSYPSILVQKGMFVLKPNYHGSSNHGLPFLETIKGNYYEPELEDITKAIAKLKEEGKIDMDKLGVMGWSNGAILTTMLTLHYPDMFKVAAPGAGDVNWTSDYGTCEFGVSFDQSYFGGSPWDDMNGKTYNENYILKSPLFEIEKIKTPTIIFHGSEDRAVPRDQGWEYYRGLQQVGKTPVRFLWFPGQPHGLGKITHQLRKMKEEIAWIDVYLFNKPPTKNEAFKEDSPLAALLKLQSVASSNGLYGKLHNNILIPETVLTKKDSISIGRFEVTNAQYKAFKNDHSFNFGEDNYPVALERASAETYLNWLSTTTGTIYRLPNEKEAKALQKLAHKVAKDENTLNYWAGYDLTKDDVENFKKKVSEAKASLIKEVGSLKSTKVGEADVYDLGGNLAEYYSKGVYGYSAYDLYDANYDSNVKSEFVGIRVIKE